MVGGILGQLGLPGVNQRGSNQQQHQQQHDRHGKNNYLQGIGGAAPLQAGKGQAPDTACAHAHQAPAPQQGQSQHQSQHHRRRQSRQHRRGQHPVAAVPPHQAADRGQADRVVGQRAALLRRHVPAQNPQRTGQAQTPQGRPGKTQQAHQGGRSTNAVGAQPGGTWLHRQLLAKQAEKALLQGPAEAATQHRGNETQQQQAAAVEPGNVPGGRAQALHDGDIIVVTFAEASRRQGNRHARQHDTEATRQQQEAFCPLQRLPQARLAIADVQQALPRLQLRPQPVHQLVQRCGIVTGVQLPILDPTARLHHAGSGDIVVVHQHPGTEAEKGPALVGLRAGCRCHGELGLANRDPGANAHIQQREQP